MRRTGHRELRDSSGEVLRAVVAGETIEITDHGVVAAAIDPPPTAHRDILDELEARGELVRGTRSSADLGSPL